MADDLRRTVVSGGWQIDEQDRYRVGYSALVPQRETWNGWAIPYVTRAVLERFVRDQEALRNGPYGDNMDRLSVVGGKLVVHADPSYPPEDDNDGKGWTYTPINGLYDISLGYTWEEVNPEECLEVVRDDGTVARGPQGQLIPRRRSGTGLILGRIW